jgi:SAM-dependent methyltransferase
MSGNEQQVEFWNGPVGERWVAMQDMLDAGMADIAAKGLSFARAKPGMRVIDIGCGCGTTTFALAEAVGAGGAVTGVDISAPMLAFARKRGAEAKSRAQFVEADASDFPFKPENDLVFSRFGVMFFADPPAAFANIRKALKPGGRLVFACWRTLPENEWSAVPFMAARDLLPQQAPPDPTAPGPFAFADAARVKNILEQAGFRNIRIEKLDTNMHMGVGLDEAVDMSTKAGPLARALGGIEDEAVKTKIRARVKDALAKYAKPGGVSAPAACWLVEANA